LVAKMDRESIDEIKRHFEVVSEGLRTEIGVLAESVGKFREETKTEFAAIRREFSEINGLICLT
jgi:hypothetical protein